MLHISVAPALFFAVLIYLMMRNIPTAAADIESLREYFNSLKTLLRRPAMISLVVVTALRSTGQSAVMAFLPVYLNEELGYEFVVIGLFMSGAQVTGIVVQPIMGYLSDRFGRKVVLVPCTAAMGLLIAALKFADSEALLILTILAMGAFPLLPPHHLHSQRDGRRRRTGAIHRRIPHIRSQLPRRVLPLGSGRHS